MTAAPLAGRRILVTRAPHQAGELVRLLREHDAIPVEVPVLDIAPPQDFASLDAALVELASPGTTPLPAASSQPAFDWLLLTSANAVHAMVARAAALGLPLPASHTSGFPAIAAIGKATAAAARRAGFSVSLVPEQAVGESLAAALVPHIPGRRVLLVRAATARDILPDSLRAAGATVVLAEAYRNVVPESSIPLLARAVEQGMDAATFTSSSSVTHLAALAAAAGIEFPLRRLPAISIGPITTASLLQHNWSPAAEAESADIPALLAAVKSIFTAR